MEIIEKFISTHPLIIFFFVLAEAIIIIFLIGRLLSKWAEESDNTTNLSESDAKHIKETNKWHNECNKLNISMIILFPLFNTRFYADN